MCAPVMVGLERETDPLEIAMKICVYHNFSTCALKFWYNCTIISVQDYYYFSTCALKFQYKCTIISVQVYYNFSMCAPAMVELEGETDPLQNAMKGYVYHNFSTRLL